MRALPGRLMGEAKGSRYNTGKWIPTFWPREALEAAARVWEFGAKKYARDDWKGGMPHTEIADCALRHLHAWLDGEDLDPESGLHHVWHVLCNVAMLVWMVAKRPDLDDRVRKEAEPCT